MLRLNKYDGYEDLFTEAMERFSKAIGVYHTGSKTKENPHYHFVIDSDIHLRDTIRKHFKKYFDKGSGNQHMSIKPCDDKEEVYSYLFHEDDKEDFKIVYNNGHDLEDINRYKELNNKIKEDIKNNTVDKNIEQILEKIRLDGDRQERIFNIYRDQWVSDSDLKHFENKKKIFKYIMEHYMEKGGWLPNKYQCDRMIMKIQVLLCNSKSETKKFIDCQFNEWYSDKHLRYLIS